MTGPDGPGGAYPPGVGEFLILHPGARADEVPGTGWWQASYPYGSGCSVSGLVMERGLLKALAWLQGQARCIAEAEDTGWPVTPERLRELADAEAALVMAVLT